MSFHKFEVQDAAEPHEADQYGSFEVFYTHGCHGSVNTEPGWYWWACFPGCLPDGEASGPFKTEQEAIDDAQEGA